jgi:predicted ATPase
MAERGQPDEARWVIERALAECEQTNQRWCEAEVWRRRGEVLLHDAPSDQAEAARCFERALAMARGQGAKLWELRTAVSLARMLADQGKKARAVELLASTYGWFSEGFDSPDLVEARMLLRGLGQGLHGQCR